jgi:polyisoprenoid-binding protein YceI
MLSTLMLGATCGFPLSAQADWEIDPTHTHVSFEVGHLGLTRTPGLFRDVHGSVSFDEQRIESSSVTMTISAASIDTVSAPRDAALRGADWFDAEHSPQIRFVSRQVRRVDDRHYVIAGDLTLRGRSVPVEFAATLTQRITNPFLKVPGVGFVATARVKRSDFGMNQYLGVIDDDVDLKIQLELNRKS